MKRWLLIFVILINGQLTAQDDSIPITVAVDMMQQALLNDEFFAPFETAHSGVDVIPIPLEAADALSISPDSDAAIQALRA
jgi:hypothetical protein